MPKLCLKFKIANFETGSVCQPLHQGEEKEEDIGGEIRKNKEETTIQKERIKNKK